MKPNEFAESQQLDELGLNHLIGDYGAAAARQIGNRILGRPEGQMSIKDKMGVQIYTDNFVGRLATSLSQAIKSGIVDVNIVGGPNPPTGGPNPPPAPPAPPTGGPNPPPAPPTGGPNPPPAPPPAPPAPPTGGPNPPPAPPPAPNSPAGIAARKAALARSKSQRAASQVLGTGWSGAKNASQARGISFESKYDKLNALFESIMLSEAQGVTAYINNWLAQYPSLRGVNLKSKDIQKLIKDVAIAYKNNSGQKAALTKLANATYSLIYGSRRQPPTGGPNPPPAPPPAPPAPPTGGPNPPPAPPTGGPNPPPAPPVDAWKQVQLLVKQLTARQKAALLRYLNSQVNPNPPPGPTP